MATVLVPYTVLTAARFFPHTKPTNRLLSEWGGRRLFKSPLIACPWVALTTLPYTAMDDL